MKPLLPLLSLLVTITGCQTSFGPYPSIGSVHYSAAGYDPFWTLAIGPNDIAFRKAGEVWRLAPRSRSRTVDGVRIWRSREDDGLIVEARPGPCTNQQGQTFEDQVLVRLSGETINLEDGSSTPFHEELGGCGGRLVRSEDR